MSGFDIKWIFCERSADISGSIDSYLNALGKLYAKAMKEGAVETAHMIDEEINKFAPDPWNKFELDAD